MTVWPKWFAGGDPYSPGELALGYLVRVEITLKALGLLQDWDILALIIFSKLHLTYFLVIEVIPDDAFQVGHARLLGCPPPPLTDNYNIFPFGSGPDHYRAYLARFQKAPGKAA
jgi:hypothetical protein